MQSSNHKRWFAVLGLWVLIGLSLGVAPIGLAASPEGGGSSEKDAPENGYNKKLTKYNTYQAEIKSIRREIQGVIKEMKAVNPADPQKNSLMERVLVLHDDLELAVKNYNRVAYELRFQYPEKMDQTKRKYLPYRKQSLEQIEKELDLDDILTEAQKQIDLKYKKFTDTKKKVIVRKIKKGKVKRKDRQKGLEIVF